MRQRYEGGRSGFDLRFFGAFIAAVLLVMALGIVPYSVFPIVGALALLAALVAAVAGAGALLDAVARMRNAMVAQRPEEEIAMQHRLRIGKVEAALMLFGALVIAGEVLAIIGGYGAFFAVVSLGYFMAAGAGYLVYRRLRTEQTDFAAQPAAGGTTATAAVPLGIETEAVHPMVAESHAVARQSDLLRRLSEEQAEAVLALARWTAVPAGSRLAEAGKEGETVYIIVDGHVQLAGHSDVGEVTVRVAGEGESFPLAVLLGDGRLVTTATAMTDLWAYAIPRKQLTALCAARPEIGMAIYIQVAEILAERYRSMLTRHMTGVGNAARQPDLWANV